MVELSLHRGHYDSRQRHEQKLILSFCTLRHIAPTILISFSDTFLSYLLSTPSLFSSSDTYPLPSLLSPSLFISTSFSPPHPNHTPPNPSTPTHSHTHTYEHFRFLNHCTQISHLLSKSPVKLFFVPPDTMLDH